MGYILDKSWSIALKIWLFSAFLYSLVMTILFIGQEVSMLLFVFFIGVVIAMYSFPLFFILFILLMILAHKKYSFVFQMIIIYTVGIVGAIADCWIVANSQFDFIYLIAPVAGTLVIFTQTGSIKKLMQPENPIDELLKTE